MSLLNSFIRELSFTFKRVGKTTVPDGQNAPKPSPAVVFANASRSERLVQCESLEAQLHSGNGDFGEWTRLGDWYLELSMLAKSENAFRQALHLKPTFARAHEGLGLALLKQGQVDEAYLRLETATRLTPGNAEAWIHWGLVELERGNLASAEEKFKSGIDRAPNNAHGWHNLGLVSLQRGEVLHGIELFQRALLLKPDHGLAFSNLALALVMVDRLEEAAVAAHRSTDLKPNNARAWVVRADVAIAGGDHRQAQDALDRAVQLDSLHIGAHIALAKLHLLLGRPDAAILTFEAARAIEPGNAEIRAGLAQVRLLKGEWATGWPLYEARKDTISSPVQKIPLPEWKGEDCDGVGVLVHAEQGLGDVVLFASCLPDLHARGAHITLALPKRLHALFARSFPWAKVITQDLTDASQCLKQSQTSLELQIPIGSLPRWFRESHESFPARESYLRADPDRIEYWKRELGADNRRNVGITWRGGLATTGKYQRSLQLSALIEALSPSGARLVSLQYGECADELAQLPHKERADVHPGLHGYGDLDDLAALTAACDCIVTVCSTQAHLTGALGVPGLVLIPKAANWRYGIVGEDIPWYPSLSLVRQASNDDWTSPLIQAGAWVTKRMCLAEAL